MVIQTGCRKSFRIWALPSPKGVFNFSRGKAQQRAMEREGSGEGLAEMGWAGLWRGAGKEGLPLTEEGTFPVWYPGEAGVVQNVAFEIPSPQLRV